MNVKRTRFYLFSALSRIIKNIFDNAKTISNVRKGFKMANNHQINITKKMIQEKMCVWDCRWENKNR